MTLILAVLRGYVGNRSKCFGSIQDVDRLLDIFVVDEDPGHRHAGRSASGKFLLF